jgi:predicted metal-dependent HD superfamily phosphohydrolase
MVIDDRQILRDLGMPESDVSLAVEYLEESDHVESVYGRPAYTLREFHNRSHVKACIQDAMAAGLSYSHITPSDMVNMAAALLFHDCVYVPMAQDNEEKSAQAFTGLCDRSVPPQTVAEVQRMILATKTHKADDLPAKIICDADMAILGTSWMEFMEYEFGIRKEYDVVSPDLFFRARKGILKGWLKSCPFQTDYFEDRYWARAQENIAKLLALPEYAGVVE